MKKILLKKEKGTITSLLIGQMIVIIVYLLLLLNFRISMLSSLTRYIDDALSDATLAGMIINTEEYGKSNQILVSGGDSYTYDTSDGRSQSKNYWKDNELDILYSVKDNGSYIKSTIQDIPEKTKVDKSKRNVSNKIFIDNKGNLEEHTFNSLFSIENALITNLSNTYSSKPANTNINSIKNGLKIKKNSIKNGYADNYLDSDIEVGIQLNSVYRKTLNETIKFNSEFTSVSSGGSNSNAVRQIVELSDGTYVGFNYSNSEIDNDKASLVNNFNRWFEDKYASKMRANGDSEARIDEVKSYKYLQMKRELKIINKCKSNGAPEMYDGRVYDSVAGVIPVYAVVLDYGNYPLAVQIESSKTVKKAETNNHLLTSGAINSNRYKFEGGATGNKFNVPIDKVLILRVNSGGYSTEEIDAVEAKNRGITDTGAEIQVRFRVKLFPGAMFKNDIENIDGDIGRKEYDTSWQVKEVVMNKKAHVSLDG